MFANLGVFHNEMASFSAIGKWSLWDRTYLISQEYQKRGHSKGKVTIDGGEILAAAMGV